MTAAVALEFYDQLLMVLGLGLVGIGLSRRSVELAHQWARVYAVLIVVAWSARFWHAGHLPIFGAYESALSLACFTGVTLWIMGSRTKEPLLFLYAPTAALLLYHGTRYSREVWALTISERGFWVHFHAILAFLAFGFAMALVSASVLVFLGRKPPLKRILLGFLALYALNIISGSYYRFLLFGKAWSFDPIEAMNLACFLAFTTVIHMVSFRGWGLKKTAAWTLFCVVLLVLAYRLILIFPAWSSYHILDIDLRMHILPE